MRIMIFGLPGSGKSTFALKLSNKLNLPLFHIDRYFYKDNASWIERDYKEFMEIQKQIVSKKDWIIDGNNIDSLELRYSNADIAIYFHFSRALALWGIFKRRFWHKDSSIKDRAIGCYESISWSLIKYLWSFDERVKSLVIDLHARYPHVKFFVVRNQKEVLTLFDNLT